MILFGHPTGNPNSHHAALAHFQAGRLAACCVPWMPTPTELAWLGRVPGLAGQVQRLARRSFAPLLAAPKIQGRLGEVRRLWRRWRGRGDEGLAYEANDWLMNTMARECRRADVSAVHAYEDCSLWQFEEAKRLGKACIYDMPIGYYPAWEQTLAELAKQFANWLPPGGLSSSRWVRPEQKRREMELADLVFAPSAFVKETILRFHPNKKVALAPYGVDIDFWKPSSEVRSQKSEAREQSVPSSVLRPPSSAVRFIYAGQCSIRKGIPMLLEAWRKAGLREAALSLVGSWQLAEDRRVSLPPGLEYHPPCSAAELRRHYQSADVFLFPSFFEGFGLVLLEAMACGLPVVATEATAGPDVLDETCGKIIPAGNEEALVEVIRWFASNREKIPAMKTAARIKAESCTWANYRRCVKEAVAKLGK
jgi:glycosyltransferase involved in cell wall biosynthesis